MIQEIDPSFEFKIAQESIRTLREIVKGNPEGEEALRILRQDRERSRQRLDRERERTLDKERKERQVLKIYVWNGYDYPELTNYARDLIHRKKPMKCCDIAFLDHHRANINQQLNG